MGTPKTPETESTAPFSVGINTALAVLEHAATLDQKEATRQAALELLNMADTDEPLTLDREEIDRMAQTLGISPKSIDKALKLRIIPPEEQRRDDGRYGIKKDFGAEVAESKHYLIQLGNKILEILRDNFPSATWYSAYRIDQPWEENWHQQQMFIDIMFTEEIRSASKRRSEFPGFTETFFGKPAPAKQRNFKVATISIGLKEKGRYIGYPEGKKASTFAPWITNLLGKLLAEEGFEITRHYAIRD
ncbi:MAG: hypothetical protein WC651_02040 [Candidatus Gracilibacteria bacterium]|jgi:hypothetical protein